MGALPHPLGCRRVSELFLFELEPEKDLLKRKSSSAGGRGGPPFAATIPNP